MTAPVIAIKSGTNLYVRHAHSLAYHKVRRMADGVAASASGNGQVDFVGTRLIPTSTLAADTEAAYNAVTSASLLWLHASNDNNPPVRHCNHYVGGGHSVAAYILGADAPHGLTNAAVGEVGADTVPKLWQLVKIVDANRIMVVAISTGLDVEHWNIAGSPPTGPSSITFPGIGVFSYSTRVATQAWPMLQNHVISRFIDGEEFGADGVYTGGRVELRERYGIPNPAAWMAIQVAEKGTMTPKWINDPAVPTQVEIAASHQFDEYGSMVTYFDYYGRQALTRSSSDYVGGQQWQPACRYSTGGERLFQYVRGLAWSVGGLDLSALADITDNVASISIATADSANPALPESVFAQQVRTATGVQRFSFVNGYVPTIGQGQPHVLAASCTYLETISPSEKQYPHAADAKLGSSVPAGEALTIVSFNGYTDLAAHPSHTVNLLVKLADGKVLWVFDAHAPLDGEWVVPGGETFRSELVGKPISLLSRSVGLTLHTAEVISANGARISNPTSQGWISALIG